MGSKKSMIGGALAGLLASAAIGCQTAKAMDAKSLCETLEKQGVVANCRSADLEQNGVTRKEAMQFTIKFADEIAYGGQVMVFNAAGDIDAYKAAADEKQKAYIKENKLEALADRQMPQHFENREKLVLVTILPGPAVGKVDVKLKEIPTIISGK